MKEIEAVIASALALGTRVKVTMSGGRYYLLDPQNLKVRHNTLHVETPTGAVINLGLMECIEPW